MEPENRNDQYVVGSAESLTPDETRERLQELEAWGVDLTLVRASLDRTPTERVTRMIKLLEFAKELRRSYVAQTSNNDLQILPEIEAVLRLRNQNK